MCTFGYSTCGRVVLLGYEVLSKEVSDKEWFYWESPLMEVPDMGQWFNWSMDVLPALAVDGS